MAKRKYEQDKEEMKIIGRRIKSAMSLLGITYKEIEEEAHIPAGTVQKYVYGIAYVSGQLLAFFCKKGVNPCWILTGEGEMKT